MTEKEGLDGRNMIAQAGRRLTLDIGISSAAQLRRVETLLGDAYPLSAESEKFRHTNSFKDVQACVTARKESVRRSVEACGAAR
jgi:hypothetical protein